LPLRSGRNPACSLKCRFDALYCYCRRKAWIANFGVDNRPSWRVLREKNEIQSDWTGDYESVEAALAVLQEEFE